MGLGKNNRMFLEELYELIRIPSVSAQSEHKGDMKKASLWVKNALKEIGATAKIKPTGGHPAVTGEIRGKSDFTILFYGHYDVQPEGDLREWKSPPFEPTLRKGRVYARGGADNKFQFYSHLKACETVIQERGELPVNVKFLIEGEEEVGSENLKAFVKRNSKLLKSNVVFIADSPTYTEKIPNISLGVRGLLYVQIDVAGPKNELHSGIHGGVLDNPNEAVAHIVSSLKRKVGKEEKILIPGFYDDVVPIPKREREYIKSLRFSDKKYMREMGVKRLVGESGYSTLEKRTARPTLEVHGLCGGYIKEGAKTSIPTNSFAKISMRLVPKQDPQKIYRRLDIHLKASGFPYALKQFSGEKAYMLPIGHPFIDVATRAVKNAWKQNPVYTREGGTLPIYFFPEYTGAENLMVGYGSPNDNWHGPNESFLLENFWKGINTSINIMDEFASLDSR